MPREIVRSLISFCFLSTALFLSAALSAAVAAEPLAASADRATHIVVGTVKNVAVVSLYNNILYKLNPEPRQLASYTAAQLEVQVDEVLYPPGWKPAGTIKYLYGGGLATVAQIRADTQGKRLVFVMLASDDNRIRDNSPVFYPGQDGPAGLPVSAKSQLRDLIDRRLRREQAQGGAKPAAALR